MGDAQIRRNGYRSGIGRQDLRSSSRAKASSLLLALLLAGSTFVAAAGSSSASAPSPVPRPLADVSVVNEDFEGNASGATWTFGDSDPYNGTDLWGVSTYRAFAGNGSAWSAQVGNRTEDVTLLSDDFEGNISANWSFKDNNVSDTLYGEDYWGPSNYRPNSGSWSIWCAQVGTNDATTGVNNTAIHRYDDDMNATATRNVSVSGYVDVRLEYSYWLDSEASYDGLMVIYWTGRWSYVDTHSRRDTGQGWQRSSVSLPATTTQVGFLFTSDYGQQFDGAYVDDLLITGTKLDLNSDLHEYDDGSNATMYRGVDVSTYDSARLEYRYWLDTESPNDTLQVMYFAEGNWTYTDNRTGNSSGWQLSALAIPTKTTLVGFRFFADGLGHREGAYVDEVKVWGTVLSPTCAANVSAVSGIEFVTTFYYSGAAGLGRPPYSWSWDFGDGTSAIAQNPTHVYRDVGSYTATMSMRDSLGQICTAPPVNVTVDHDISSIFVTPAVASPLEGESATFYVSDARGHALDAAWALSSASCGDLSATSGSSATFTASTSAGGSLCSVSATYANVSSAASITISHNATVIMVTPTEAHVPEGGAAGFGAVDAFGHELAFTWTTTCGRIAPDTGPSTTFTAVATGGTTCAVTVAFGTVTTTALVFVEHDTSTISVTPGSATLREGASQVFNAVDTFAHPFDAVWTVSPSGCGVFSPANGSTSTFTSATSAGGSVCTVTASAGGNSHSVTVTVDHDISAWTVDPASATLAEGSSLVFNTRDAFGHPYSVAWSLTPTACGELTAASGSTTTLNADPTTGGTLCSVSASAGSITKLATVSLNHGGPAAVVISPALLEGEEGGVALVSAVINDVGGHSLGISGITFSSTCGAATSGSAGQATVSLPQEGGGTTCTITATYQSFSATATVTVKHVGPFTLTIAPAGPASSDGSQVYVAMVKDGRGHTIENVSVTWSATCGAVSPATGTATTFTPPSAPFGTSCTILATSSVGASTPQTTATVSVGMALWVPAAAVGAPVAAALGLLMMRRRRPGEPTAAEEEEGEAAPVMAQVEVKPPAAPAPAAPPAKPAATRVAPPPKPAAPAPAKPPATLAPSPPATEPAPGTSEEKKGPVEGMCPQCGDPIEPGWMACPNCGREFL